MHMRWTIRKDMPRIMEIDQASFDEPWDEETFFEHYRERTNIGLSAECEDTVVGFMIYQLHGDHFEILRLAVDPEYRSQRIATDMLAKLQNKCEVSQHTTRPRDRVQIVVPEACLDMQMCLKANGFNCFDITEDGYVFEWWCLSGVTT